MATRTMTVDTGEELRGFVERLVESGTYKTNSEVVREGLRLLQEKQAESKLEVLRQLIDEGDSSGEAVTWDLNNFLTSVRSKIHNAQ
ncbi:type II toxin-antitoxin system ParD family antitoxin [Xenorhabdus sp. KJ12.1]|uniref:type II toxin-antitoxin system ParD family antitoxin n=1 Tax=Xenorhabdus sp. KJ12.1 TaxID=1851571 RepID=UPI000C04192A|nr:type II toxin-antitoxin system ParD family antitoxin [Xenorhabdus sp. KJ12.1]PHM67971.1 CopG family transcriptional regulator [Xenorhabdus sp. KJ12.1]